MIAELLTALELEGYEMGTARHLKLQELLRRLPEDLPAEKLASYLSPLFATSPREQERFYQIFKECLRRVKAVHDPIDEQTTPPDPTDRRLRLLTWLLGLALLLPGLYFLWIWLNPPPPPVIRVEFTLQAGTEKTKCLRDTVELKEFGNVAEGFLQFRSRPDLGKVYWKPPCLTYEADTTAEGSDSLVILIENEGGDKSEVHFLPTIQAADPIKDASKEPTPEKPKEKDPESAPPEESKPLTPSYVFTQQALPYDHDVLSLAALPNPPPWWRSFLSRNIGWIKWVGLLLFTLLLITIMAWRIHRRRVLVAELETGTFPPYAWNIELDTPREITLDASLQYTLNQLRRRTSEESFVLDVPSTVSATIEKGGLVDFQYRQQTRPPEYLLLIDRTGFNDHRARLYDLLFQTFRVSEVYSERFFFNGDIRACFNEKNPEGLTLTQLQQRYPNSRLIVIGTAYHLLSPLSGKLHPWTRLLMQWKERLLLTTRPVDNWGRKERVLGKMFSVLPASLQAISLWLESLETSQPISEVDWKKDLELESQKAIAFKGDLISSLKDHFNPDMLRWIAACGVYPKLHWDLTLFLGDMIAHTRNVPLLTLANLSSLFRLPWFVEGKMPDPARMALLDWLETEDPALLHKVRTELYGILQENKPPQNSTAYDAYAMNVAMNEWLTTTDRKRKKELEEQIAQRLEAGAEADITVLRYLDRPRTRFDFVVPDNWKRYIYPEGMPGLGMKGQWKDALRWALPVWVLLLVATAWPWQVSNYDCGGKLTRLVLDDKPHTLCLSNALDSLLFYEHHLHQSATRQEWARVDSLDKLINEVTTPPSTTGKALLEGNEKYLEKLENRITEFNENTLTHFYNLGVAYYQEYERKSMEWEAKVEAEKQRQLLASPETLFDTTRYTYADTACDIWSRMQNWVIGFSPYENTLDWCSRERGRTFDLPVQDSVKDYTLLEGRVIDAQNGDPIQGVEINGGLPRYSTLTDRQGYFSIRFPGQDFGEEDTYPLQFSAPGYRETEVDLPFNTDGPAYIRLEKETDSEQNDSNTSSREPRLEKPDASAIAYASRALTITQLPGCYIINASGGLSLFRIAFDLKELNLLLWDPIEGLPLFDRNTEDELLRRKLLQRVFSKKIPNGSQVELVRNSGLYFEIEWEGRTYYILKYLNSGPTLRPCPRSASESVWSDIQGNWQGEGVQYTPAEMSWEINLAINEAREVRVSYPGLCNGSWELMESRAEVLIFREKIDVDPKRQVVSCISDLIIHLRYRSPGGLELTYYEPDAPDVVHARARLERGGSLPSLPRQEQGYPLSEDVDGDGIPNREDACSEQAGPKGNWGCPPAEGGCNTMVFNVENFTLNNVYVNASIEVIEKAFPCFTSSDTREELGGVFNYGGGTFFTDHGFYYYTHKGVLNIRSDFKGSMTVDLFSMSRKEIQKVMAGTLVPKERLTPSDIPYVTEGESMFPLSGDNYLYYSGDFGHLVLAFSGQELSQIYAVATFPFWEVPK